MIGCTKTQIYKRATCKQKIDYLFRDISKIGKFKTTNS